MNHPGASLAKCTTTVDLWGTLFPLRPFVRFNINNGFLMSQGVFGIPECPVEPEDDPCDRLREAFYPLIYSDLIQEHVAPAEVILPEKVFLFTWQWLKRGICFCQYSTGMTPYMRRHTSRDLPTSLISTMREMTRTRYWLKGHHRNTCCNAFFSASERLCRNTGTISSSWRPLFF